MKLFGFSIVRDSEQENVQKEIDQSFVPKQQEEDGAFTVNSGGSYGQFVDMEASAKTEADLITRYRTMSQHAEVQNAIDNITNQAIVVDKDQKVVEINLDAVDTISKSTKNKIQDEFKNCLSLLDFSNYGQDLWQRWYVDGRLRFHIVIDENNIADGIKDIRYIDPRKIRKVRETEKKRNSEGNIVTVIKNEYFVYSEKGFHATSGQPNYSTSVNNFGNQQYVVIAKDSILNITSGLVNENGDMVLSYLHKAIKPLNQLRYMEDAAVIYRLSRAPERRIFYIDVGNLPKAKAEQYLQSVMTRHKNKLVYDAATGTIRDDRKFMTMLEDMWFARREGGKGTEVSTLPGGQNLGQLEDIEYFQKKLFQSLHVPLSRLDAESGFQLGRASEISRDEVLFTKFIQKLRARFSILFDRLLETQLVMKNIITPEDWKDIQNGIRYDFIEDNFFEELKNAEIMQQRVGILTEIDPFVGKYYSQEWIKKNVLMQSEDEMEQIAKQILKEGPPADDGEEDQSPQQQNQQDEPEQHEDIPEQQPVNNNTQ